MHNSNHDVAHWKRRLNMDSIFHAHKLWKKKQNVPCMQRLWNKLENKQRDINRKFDNELGAPQNVINGQSTQALDSL
jgi:hypothetical protein